MDDYEKMTREGWNPAFDVAMEVAVREQESLLRFLESLLTPKLSRDLTRTEKQHIRGVIKLLKTMIDNGQNVIKTVREEQFRQRDSPSKAEEW